MENKRSLKETASSQTKRKCLNNYTPLCHKIKDIILSMYVQNPQIMPQVIYEIESKLGLKRNKIMNFLNYEKKKLLQYSKGSYKKFSKKDRSILERKFNKNSDLSKEDFSNLKKKLSEKSSKKIRNWFDYRKRKMKLIEEQKKNNQVQEEENTLVSSHSDTEIANKIHFQNNTNNSHNLNLGLETNYNYKIWHNSQLNMMKYRTYGQILIPKIYYVNPFNVFGSNYNVYYLSL